MCRNLLIYLSAELQKKLLPIFHYCLNGGGILFLGSAETIGTHTDLFAPLDGKARLYRRLDPVRRSELPTFPLSPARLPSSRQPSEAVDKASPPNLQQLANQLLLEQYSPSAVLSNDKGDILYIQGRTGKYLEPAAGKVNWNILAMAREGLRLELNNAFHKALQDRNLVEVKRASVEVEQRVLVVDIVVQPLQEPESLRGMVLVVFRDVENHGRRKRAISSPADERSASLEELTRSREESQGLREEMQTFEEEVRSTNEELQSTNEELQSANEELTTSKEELQSLNEELHTLNQELQARVTDLSAASNDMKNFLDSTEIAILFLDEGLCIRRFTPLVNRIIKLIPGDVGRCITDIVSNLDYPGLAQDAREVMRSLAFIEKQASASEGRWFTVRIMPYRTLDNRIDGLVITFLDISVRKQLEEKVRQGEERFKLLLESREIDNPGGDLEEESK